MVTQTTTDTTYAQAIQRPVLTLNNPAMQPKELEEDAYANLFEAYLLATEHAHTVNNRPTQTSGIAWDMVDQYRRNSIIYVGEDNSLSCLETRVLDLLLQGTAFDAIADTLSLPDDITRSQILSVCKKLYLFSTTETVITADVMDRIYCALRS